MTVQQKFNLQDELYKLALYSEKITLEDSFGNLEALIKTLKKFRDSAKSHWKEKQ